jgi:hypothetical protein
MKVSGVRAYSCPHGLQGGPSATAALMLVRSERLQEGPKIIGVILLVGQNLFQHTASRRIAFAEIAEDLG